MRTDRSLLGALAVAVLIATGVPGGCNKPENVENRVDKTIKNANEEMAKDRHELAQDRRDLANDLRSIRKDIDDRIQKLDDKLNDANTKESDRKDWREERAQLVEQRRRVEDGLDKITDSTDDTWASVKMSVRKSADEVDNWLDRQADKIDRKTEADYDKDGH